MKLSVKTSYLRVAAAALALLAVIAGVAIANSAPTAAQGAGVTFGTETIQDQAFIQWQWVNGVVLPEATGGSGGLTYSLSPPLQRVLRFNPKTRELTGRARNPQPAQTYTYTATDSAGNSASLNFNISVTGISPLTSPLAVRDSYNRSADSSVYTNLIVSWNLRHKRVAQGYQVQGFKVEASASDEGPWTDVTGSISKVRERANSKRTHYQYRHAGLNPGDSRFYRITTIYTSGEESQPIVTRRAVSTRSLPTPAWKSNHRIWATPGADDPEGSLLVMWNQPKNVPSALWSHMTYTLNANDGSGWSEVAAGLTRAQYLHTGLQPETTVRYQVKAIISNNAAGWTAVETSWSAEFEGTTKEAPPPAPAPALNGLPEPPGQPQVSVTVTNTTVTLTWPAVAYSDDKSTGAVFYTIEYKPAGGQWTTLSERQTGLTYTHSGLQPGTAGTYFVDPSVQVKGTNEYLMGDPWMGDATTGSSSQ